MRVRQRRRGARPAAHWLPWKFARVFRPAIRRNIKLAECPSFGKTIFEYAADSNAAEDYMRTVDRIAFGKVEKGSGAHETAPPSSEMVASAG